MAHIDIKVSLWQRIEVADEALEEIIANLKEDMHIYDAVDWESVSWHSIDDTEEVLSPEQNQDRATIIVCKETDADLLEYEEIWTNKPTEDESKSN